MSKILVQQPSDISGIVISALRGGAGKTIITLGIIAALKKSGKVPAPFKKGPDYIDAGWLALSAGRPCYNLDLFLSNPDRVLKSFSSHLKNSDIAVVEGNRGLYDGIDVEGRTSTAELAKLLDLPVVLCIDCTKTTRTMVAAVSGCMGFDKNIMIQGVILNRVAGPRHENILSKSFEYHLGLPVLGAVPKLKNQEFPERHMGLVPMQEHKWAVESINSARKIAEKYLDIDKLVNVAESLCKKAPAPTPISVVRENTKSPEIKTVKIGVIRDSAFQFYYPDNLEALEVKGADLVYLSALTDIRIPDIDGLYIGGGFPETHARILAQNASFRDRLKQLANEGLPIYAECGGLIYLGDTITIEGTTYPMSGILPIAFGLSKRPQGHGYTISRVDLENPYFEVGTEIRGHEFRYSTIIGFRGEDQDMVFSTLRGTGFQNKRDGICFKNVLASYTHLHALGTPSWAPAMVKKSREFQNKKSGL